MKALILKLLPLLFLMVWPGIVRAQTITTTAGSLQSCPGEIIVPIMVTNCNGVGAISLVLDCNSAVLTYNGYQNLHSQLASGLLIIHSTGSHVTFSWANTVAANIGDDTLVELKFLAVTGTSSLNWDIQTPGNCEYADNLGNILPSAYVNGSVTIHQAVMINTQPVNTTVLVGTNTTLTIGAIGTGLAYRWQISIDGGSAWTNLENSSLYGGVTGSTLYIYNVPLSYSANLYRCRLSGICLPVVYSYVVSLEVITPVTTTLPVSNLCPGNTVIPVMVEDFESVAAFSLVFGYNPNVLTWSGYQGVNTGLQQGSFSANANDGKVYLTWSSTTPATFPDGTLVELLFTGATGNTALTWDLSTPGNCEYTALNGSPITAVYNNGSQNVYALPEIVTQPVDRIIAKGQSTTFSVAATGSGLNYLWQVSTDQGTTWTDLSNGGFYAGVTTSSLGISNAQISLNRNLYRCRVAGNCPPPQFSNAAMLTVLPNIITICNSKTSCPGIVGISVTANDFIGVAAFSMVLNFNTSVLSFSGTQDLNTALSGGSFIANASNGKVYLTWSHTSPATIANGGKVIEILFTAVPGTSALNWDIQVAGNCEYSDQYGNVIFSTWTNGTATINQPPVISSHPVNLTMYAGGLATFSVTAAGTEIAYRWQESTDGGTTWTNLSNVSPYQNTTTSTLRINPVNLGLTGYLYRCTVSGTCTPTVYSDAAQLTVTQAAITTSIAAITNSCTGNLNIPVNVTNCDEVGGITLALIYDTTKLTFEGYHTINPGLGGGMIAINRYANKVLFTWASTTAANLGNAILVYYRFKANTGVSTSLTWDTQTPGNCEYTNVNSTIITSLYTNANITVSSTALVANAGPDMNKTGPSVQLNGTATGGVTPYTWLWSPVATLSDPNIPNPVASPSVTTVYTLTVTGNNGCSGSDQMTVFTSTIPENLTVQNVTVNDGQTECYNATQVITVAGNGTSFQVLSGGHATLIAGQKVVFQPGASVIAGGYLHAYITTNATYCGTQGPAIPATEIQGEFAISELQLSEGFRIYPNPADDFVTIETRTFTGVKDQVTIELVNLLGTIVHREQRFAAGACLIDISGLPTGVYLLRINRGDTYESARLIVR
jgi:hypothetical protein